MGTIRWIVRVVTSAAMMAGACGPLAGQGWIEPPDLRRCGPPPCSGEWGVHKTRSEVSVRVEGRVAEVVVSEWFRNRGGRVAEGDYLYPLPGEAVFQGFSLFQGDAELRGEIMDAEQARRIYEEIVRRRLDPALIELAGHGLLRARIFPIEPGQERRVTLRYTQVLERAGNALQLVYAGAVRGGTQTGTVAHEQQTRPATEPVRTRFELVIDEPGRFLEPFSPTHALRVRRERERMTVTVEEELAGRLSIFMPMSGEAVGLSVATHRPAGEDGYFMLTLSPDRSSEAVQPRDVTVVLDVSGSMSGEKIEQARAALRELLGTLGRDDRFRLIAFSNSVRMYSDDWADARRARIDDAREWVSRLAADGGTNIGAALDEAFRLESPANRLPVVIFLTDGLPSVGEQSPERLADRAESEAGRRRIFAFGVGHDVNTHLLDRLGEAGRGDTDYVEPGESVERVISLLAAKIRHPVLTDLHLDDAPVELTEVYPVRLPDVFAGQELVVFGRYRGDGEGRMTVGGRRAGERVGFATRAVFQRHTEANAYIPRLWASRKLGHLQRQIWTEGQTPGLVEEIREVALRYGLPSPYTSYLVQEPGVVADRPMLGVGGRGGAGGSTPAAPPAPSMATGQAAVRSAQEARRMREADSMEKLRRAEAEMADEVASAGTGARMVAGRLFRLQDGVWTDLAHRQNARTVRVKAFSRAYFDLLGALPELRAVLAELDSVLVAGGEVSVGVGADGVEELSGRELRELVEGFRRTASRS